MSYNLRSRSGSNASATAEAAQQAQSSDDAERHEQPATSPYAVQAALSSSVPFALSQEHRMQALELALNNMSVAMTTLLSSIKETAVVSSPLNPTQITVLEHKHQAVGAVRNVDGTHSDSPRHSRGLGSQSQATVPTRVDFRRATPAKPSILREDGHVDVPLIWSPY